MHFTCLFYQKDRRGTCFSQLDSFYNPPWPRLLRGINERVPQNERICNDIKNLKSVCDPMCACQSTKSLTHLGPTTFTLFSVYCVFT